MPIVEHVDPAVPLSQGDVLKDVKPYFSNWSDNGIQHSLPNCIGVLVLSRPCVAAHKAAIIVAEIDAYTEKPPKECTSFEDIRDFLTTLRDGKETPDRLYLGQITGLGQGRYRAKLDAIHTVAATSGPSRASLISKRIGRLSKDFARDLHIRIFSAFASLGFEDDSWFSTADLNWLASAGESELAAKQQALASNEASGNDTKALEREVEKLRTALSPYLAEQERRAV